MTKGSNTRSGLLWEVERLLNECEELPQVLLMENVPQVHSKKNMPDFQKWMSFLESKGYRNFWQDLNAKDFGVAQSRNRCFMVSLLHGTYTFPKPIPLTKCMKDYLEDEVDEKYYLNTEKARDLIDKLIRDGKILNERTNEQELTCPTPEQRQQTSAHASKQDTMAVSTDQRMSGQESVKCPSYLNRNKVAAVNVQTALPMMARDYKGFGTSSDCQNGVIEWKKHR